eukprot:4435842-Pyramimonas_sp.AAC.1
MPLPWRAEQAKAPARAPQRTGGPQRGAGLIRDRRHITSSKRKEPSPPRGAPFLRPSAPIDKSNPRVQNRKEHRGGSPPTR